MGYGPHEFYLLDENCFPRLTLCSTPNMSRHLNEGISRHSGDAENLNDVSKKFLVVSCRPLESQKSKPLAAVHPRYELYDHLYWSSD
jgi:hypothetical protein